MRSASVSTKFAAYHVLIVALVLTITSAYLVSSLESRYVDLIQQRLATSARMIAASLSEQTLDNIHRLDVNLYEKITESRVTIIDPFGRVLLDSEKDPSLMENHSDRPEFIEALSKGIGSRVRYSSTLGTHMLYVAVPIPGSTGDPEGVVRLSLETSELERLKRAVGNQISKTALVACLLVAGGTIVISRSITNPLRELLSGVAAIKEGNYGHKVPINNNDEIGQLCKAFNEMSIELQTKIREINDEKARSQAILRNMADGVIAVNTAGEVFLFNNAASNIFNRPASEVLNRQLLDAIRNHELKQILDDALSSGFVSREMQFLTPVKKYLRVHASRLENEAGEVAGVVGVVQDVTDLKRLEQMRTEFVANVSHELKTPLTAIKGFVEALLDGAHDDPGTRLRFLDIIARESQRLESLISDLLDLSRIESGRLQMSRQPLNLHEIVGQVFRFFASAAAEKSITLCNQVSPTLEKADGDPGLISQVLTNLIDNSVKYSGRGGRVSVSAQVRDDYIEVSVADNGIGIPREHLPRIFERFYRVDKARSRELGGTGLGLSIVKHIVESHGGSVRIESEVGKGTIVTFTLPLWHS